MLSFSPLYWIYHDCWHFTETLLVPNKVTGKMEPHPANFDHAGHVHFFMPDYSTLKNATQQAYTGSQQYHFEIEDVWGPNSSDPNQMRSYKLVGKPRWYFYIEEYWRRIYIQPWDMEDYSETYPNHPGRLGIRYDASKPQHSFGPFREGGGLYFFDTEMNRTLPVEYWLNEEKDERQHFLKKQHYSWDETKGDQIWRFEKEKRKWSRRGRGWYSYWEGDNAFYDEDGWTYLGYNKPGDIVCIQIEDRKHFYRYKLIPSVPTTKAGEKYWPNPTPNGTLEQHRTEFLTYYDFHSEYGDKYTKEYEEWLEDNKTDNDQKDFETFVGLKNEEFQRNCLSEDMQTMNYEFISFEDYRELWEELTREEIIKLGLLGDYPMLKEGVSVPTASDENGEGGNPPGFKSAFGTKEDPFHNDRPDGDNNVNPYEVYKEYFETREEYTIPRGREASGDKPDTKHPREYSFSDEDGARRYYPDNMYVTPVIEYQKVIQRNYERLPERLSAEANIDIWTDPTGNFGDGFSVTINIPYRVNGVVQSPFSDDKGVVYPPGNYFHTFDPNNGMRYQTESYGDPIPDNAKDKDDYDYGTRFTNVKMYDRTEYNKFMKGNPKQEEINKWFNENYANRPILFHPDEGMFDADGNWIEPVTFDHPTDNQVIFDDSGKPTLQGTLVKFETHGLKEDGIWVEQCLGAIVKPKVELIFEDMLGHRFSRWVESMEAHSENPFVGRTE